MRASHDDLGHLGSAKKMEDILEVYWFPDMKQKVKDYIFNCLKCVEFAPVSGKNEGFLHSIEKEKLPFQVVHADHLGPFEKTSKGFKHLLIIIDGFTKFTKLYLCKSTSSSEAIKHFVQFFKCYSKPRRIVTDRGTAFTADAFKEFFASESVKHVLIAVGNPRANGQVERYNRVITPMLAKLAETPNKLDRVIDNVEFALNNTVSSATGKAPSELLFGIRQLGSVNDEVRLALERGDRPDFDEMREDANDKIKKMQMRNETLYNKTRKPATVYKVGDYVMIKNVETTVGVNKKLIPQYKGPYGIASILDNDRYIVKDIEGFQVTQIPYNGVVSPDRMKMYVK